MGGEPKLLLDEHVSRVFERVCEERGMETLQAKDQFGEQTTDEELLEWCGDRGYLFVTNDITDFKNLHGSTDHSGILVYHSQSLPEKDPEGLVTAVEEVFDQYGPPELSNSVVELEDWYDWLHE